MDFLNNRKLNGFYRGTVLKHLYGGKCKVYIYGIYNEELMTYPDGLPDAEQAMPIFGGSSEGSGMFSYPNLGSTVWCFFQNGDQNYPVIFATTLAGENAKNEWNNSGPLISQNKYYEDLKITDETEAAYEQADLENIRNVLFPFSSMKKEFTTADKLNAERNRLSQLQQEYDDTSAFRRGKLREIKNKINETEINIHNLEKQLEEEKKQEEEKKKEEQEIKEFKPDKDAYIHKIKIKRSTVELNEAGFIKISTRNKDDTNTCTMTLDADGNLTIDSTVGIYLVSDLIRVEAEKQLDLISDTVNIVGDRKITLTSPFTEIDTSKGHTKVKYKSYTLKPKVNQFIL